MLNYVFKKPDIVIKTDSEFNFFVIDKSKFDIPEDFNLNQKSFEIVDKLFIEQVTKNENNLIFKAKKVKFKTTDFTINLPNYEPHGEYITVRVDYQKLINAVKFCEPNSVKPESTGVAITETGGIVSTDSFKLYIDGDMCDNHYIIPVSFINEIPVCDTVELRLYPTRVEYISDDKRIISRIIAAKLPISSLKNIRNISYNNDFIIDFQANVPINPESVIEVSVNNKIIKYTIYDNESEIEFEQETDNTETFSFKTSVKYLQICQKLSNHVFVSGNRMLRFGDNVILLCMI